MLVKWLLYGRWCSCVVNVSNGVVGASSYARDADMVIDTSQITQR